LRQAGPLTVAELARRLNRDYKNVHTDVNQLIEWMAVERGDDGRVNVPWSEIVVDMKLPERVAA
jgi:predicted transcriptional regulator